jgi:asparagine synthase (glutamine-hydrolysing)
MCGICGIVNATGDPRRHDAAVRAMTGDLIRRGPDDEGTWTSTAGQASLGFRRLAIIDPTPAGTQPMWSADRGAVLVFNGEIYNHRELRHGHCWVVGSGDACRR